ncbi:uncharacterized protein LOC122014196 [Zingiber officinale]|uniref:uncharacterized protein LOC122014196 n=1 Tax=Zingiber officinale TaxID=94328 RepID=UPI001C4D9059|nr:uncharacterized protein LOC122014196 [Zingiber officinale]
MAESFLPRDSRKGKALIIPEMFPEDPDEKVPFSARILNEKLPKGYRAPSIGEYDGSKDLEDHLRKFRNAALLHQYSDAVKCRVFLNTLSGSALQWFDELSQGSITCFLDFKMAFLRHFASSKKYQKTDYYLFALKQGSTEPLRSYINRFNQVAQDVPTATSEILMSAFCHGLGEGEFFRDLIKNPARNFDEMVKKSLAISRWKKCRRPEGKLRDHLHLSISRKEGYPSHPLNLFHALEKAGLPSSTVRRLDRPPESQLCTLPDLDRGTLVSCRVRFTPARVSPSSAQDDIRAASHGWTGRATPPRPSRTQYSSTRSGEPEVVREAENRGNAAIREIGMISGGSTDGDLGRARKSHVRRLEVHTVGYSQEQASNPVISFGPADLEGLELPHDDALIIKAIIANSRVARVFIDTGSSVNILFRTAFEEMQIDATEL